MLRSSSSASVLHNLSRDKRDHTTRIYDDSVNRYDETMASSASSTRTTNLLIALTPRPMTLVYFLSGHVAQGIHQNLEASHVSYLAREHGDTSLDLCR